MRQCNVIVITSAHSYSTSLKITHLLEDVLHRRSSYSSPKKCFQNEEMIKAILPCCIVEVYRGITISLWLAEWRDLWSVTGDTEIQHSSNQPGSHTMHLCMGNNCSLFHMSLYTWLHFESHWLVKQQCSKQIVLVTVKKIKACINGIAVCYCTTYKCKNQGRTHFGRQRVEHYITATIQYCSDDIPPATAASWLNCLFVVDFQDLASHHRNMFNIFNCTEFMIKV